MGTIASKSKLFPLAATLGPLIPGKQRSSGEGDDGAGGVVLPSAQEASMDGIA